MLSMCWMSFLPQLASYAHLHYYRVANLESPFVWATTQVCFSKLVDETLATPCTHCEVAFLGLASHVVGPDCAMLSHS